MAFTTIAKPSVHFDCPTWTGSNSTTTITGMGFKPDMLWIKNYSGTGHPVLNDSTKGIGFNWIPSGNNANDTTNYVASYTSDGFTLTGNLANTNDASDSYVGACWKANGGTTSSNSSGSITSTVQANTTSGVSVVAWTGTGANGTIGHGLGMVPKLLIVKSTGLADRGINGNFGTTKISDPWTDGMQFAWEGDTTQDYATFWNDTQPTSTVFSVGSDAKTNPSSGVMIGYVFAEVQGFSKIGQYTGTGNARGTKVYCGFRPKWVLIKSANTGDDWISKVSGLTGYGVGGQRTRNVRFNSSTCQTSATVQFESNGFRMASTSTGNNKENSTYWYFAFAEMPMVSTNGVVSLAI
jgi:hypothetical protein